MMNVPENRLKGRRRLTEYDRMTARISQSPSAKSDRRQRSAAQAASGFSVDLPKAPVVIWLDGGRDFMILAKNPTPNSSYFWPTRGES
jgi:hypothetical protein